MSAPSLHRATLALGIAAAISCLFAFTDGMDQTINLIHVRGASVIVIGLLGILAIVAGVLRAPILGLVAGIVFIAAAVLQLVQLGQALNLLGGDGSTMAVMGGLGIGLVSVWLVGRSSQSNSKGSH